MNRNVLVTGANGQLAKTIRELFENNTDDIIFSFFSKNDLDISSIRGIKDQFEVKNYDYCINCAAYTNVDAAEDNYESNFQINADGARNLALVCKEYKVRLIHISTDYIFDGKSSKPYKIDDPTNPINAYGKAKLEGEINIKNVLNEFYIIRTSWLYSIYGKNFLTTMCNKVRENSELKIITSQRGTPTSCIELSKFIYHLIRKNNISFGTYHFSANGEATWFDFAKRIAENYKEYDLQRLKPVETFKTKATRPLYSVFNIEKTEKVYKSLEHWTQCVDYMVSLFESRSN